ncbi:hypothetical protein KKA03_02350 [archaeon]|nr:hypothetical protein [archaeon]
MNRAIVTFEYKNKSEAEVVLKMLDVDNKAAPKTLKIETIKKDNLVITTLEHEKTGTIFATVDDLIFTERLVSGLVGEGK